MKITFSQSTFAPEENHLSLHKEFSNGACLYYDLFLLGDKFLEYQKDLFDEFLADIVDNLTNLQPTSSVNHFKRYFETKLSELNAKLNMFAEKIRDINRLDIRGAIQIFYEDTYMSSLIGDVSVVILRDSKLNYVLSNEVDLSTKIDTFSDFVEGNIESNDEIMVFGINIENVMDEQDIKETAEISYSEQMDLKDCFIDILQNRIKKEEIVFVFSSRMTFEFSIKKEAVKFDIKNKLGFLEKYKDGLVRFRYPIIISVAVIIIIFLLYSLVSSFLGKDAQNFVKSKDGVFIGDVSREGIAKDLARFKKLDAETDEKGKVYQDIKRKLDYLESVGKWPEDVKQWRNTLNSEYYRGFRIFLIGNEDISEKLSFKFSDDQKQAFGTIFNMFRNRGVFFVGGSKGALIGGLKVKDNYEGKLVPYNVDQEFSGCVSSLLKDGFYCYSHGGDIVFINKNGISSVVNDSGGFTKNLVSVEKRNKPSSIYTLTSDPSLTSKGIYLINYSNLPGKQDRFKRGQSLTIKPELLDKYKDAISEGFNDLAIDGTFLLWSKKDKKLYQMYRADKKSADLEFREVPLAGGTNMGDDYSSDVKIISSDNSTKVYLFDKENQTLTIYRSNPMKTNTSYNTSYGLKYFYRIKFSLDSNVSDIYINEDNPDKVILYFVNSDGIYQKDLTDYTEANFNSGN